MHNAAVFAKSGVEVDTVCDIKGENEVDVEITIWKFEIVFGDTRAIRGDEDFDVESLDLDEETPVEVVEDILADDTDTQ